MARSLFGTDGVRGRANSAPMTAEIAMRIGMAAGTVFNRGDHRHRAVVGKDTRLSGYMIEQALTAGFLSVGMDVLLLGPAADAGGRLPDALDARRCRRHDLGLAQSLRGQRHQAVRPRRLQALGRGRSADRGAGQLALEHPARRRQAIGRAKRLDDADGRYIEAVKASARRRLDLSGLKIVVDCANGAAYKVAPTVLWELGAEVISIGVAPDGFNINAGCGSTHPEALQEHVVMHGADIGIALDGDADRLVMVCEKGERDRRRPAHGDSSPSAGGGTAG